MRFYTLAPMNTEGAAAGNTPPAIRVVRVTLPGEIDRPEPRLDADRGDGMAVTVGRVRPCKVTHTKFVALGHKTVRGAAGAAILNAELMAADGLFD